MGSHKTEKQLFENEKEELKKTIEELKNKTK